MAKKSPPDSFIYLSEGPDDGEYKKKLKISTDANNITVIDLLESDEEGDAEFAAFLASNTTSPFAQASSGRNQSATGVANIKMEGNNKAEEDDDEDDGGGKLGPSALVDQWQQDSDDDDDDVMLVPPVLPEIHPAAAAAAAAAATNNDQDVELVGTVNETRLPHMRQHCTVHPFNPSAALSSSNNMEFCDLCYCYVCDKPAKECTQWFVANHCMATNSGPNAAMWNRLRQQAKSRSNHVVPTAHATGLATVPVSATVNPACRRCGELSGTDQNQESVPSCFDWCRSCGRIASDLHFGKMQAAPYQRHATDVFLGEKIVPFRLKAHDPREFETFKWAQKEGTNAKWIYNAAEMESDVFRHRLGQYPLLEMILASVPIVAEDQIPKTGFIPGERHDKERAPWAMFGMSGNSDPEDKFRVSADETDGVILSSPSDLRLLEELASFGSIGYHTKNYCAPLDGEIMAEWNPQARTGTFRIVIYLKNLAFSAGRDWGCACLSKFFGVWFGVTPFPLSDLTGAVQASQNPNDLYPLKMPLPPFKRMSNAQRDDAVRSLKGEIKLAIKKHNETAQSFMGPFSLESSDRARHGLGGVCYSESGLAGVLKSYFRATFEDEVSADSYPAKLRQLECPRDESIWILRQQVASLHRPMKKADEPIMKRGGDGYSASLPFRRDSTFLSLIRDEDQCLAVANLNQPFPSHARSRSLKGMLDHLENLHHASAPFVEGLNVELLEFQRQSLQWALEREKTPGGVQAFLWPNLPSVEEKGKEVYFNPILDRCRRDKPRLVRGGIIAEEMGLGKTVISLALILENPAPALPVSGSPVSALTAPAAAAAGGLSTTGDSTSAWDKDLYARTSETNKKRGSILSRGTLVVCHVSLVGQWIDEAKSKLKDPGLVYPYHGQSRKRDAAILAKNAIVVTTYQTLASDATFHAKKHGDGYCAPCEQVRWWRIICDESHSLREANTQKSAAVMNLVADHKWLVSGTPVNTSFNDLKNQLKFIGIENVGEMFRDFAKTAFRHTGDQAAQKQRVRKRRKRRRWMDDSDDEENDMDGKFGHFVYFLRTVMIRHAHKQKYRGTTTTLMSLPPKTERTIEVQFSNEEKQEYTALDTAARQFYVNFKAEHGHELSKHFLRLSQKLTPLRIAASGGRIPLEDASSGDAHNENGGESDDENETKKKKAKKVVKLSEFAYTSKFKVLLSELERVRDQEPDAKSLVFSQFTTTLQWLQEELPRHGFQFRTLSGDMTMKKRAKALHDFQHDPPTTIFLLSMRAGAVGINLTQANRVFLMEPHFNPALEAQAIGRVHRLGQKRNVDVVRLVMKDSVETRLVKMLQKKYGDLSTNDAEAVIGSIHTDKTTVLGAEFDLLFGIQGSADGGVADGTAMGSVDI